MKLTLTLKQQLPFAQNPRFAELDAERILCNDVILPGEHNPHNVRLWVIGNEYGAVCAVWAECEQDALDEMVDKGLGDSFLLDDEERAQLTDDYRQEITFLGNAGEPANLDYCWMGEVEMTSELIALFKSTQETLVDNLGMVAA